MNNLNKFSARRFCLGGCMQDLHISYNNPYNANSESTDFFRVSNKPFVGVMG